MIDRNHPLTEERAAELWDAHVPLVLNFQVWTWGDRLGILDAMRAAFDAGRKYGRTNTTAARPWEPLDGPLYVGDEVRQEGHGLTMTAVVGRMDGYGDPWTAEGALIGLLRHGTWYVRRAAQPEPPTRNGTVLIPAEGLDVIESKAPGERAGAEHFVLRLWDGLWYGDDASEGIPAAHITPGTWEVGNR